MVQPRSTGLYVKTGAGDTTVVYFWTPGTCYPSKQLIKLEVIVSLLVLPSACVSLFDAFRQLITCWHGESASLRKVTSQR